MLGLGGGVIYNPVFVDLNLFPQVAFSTGMYMAMFTSLSNALLFAISGQLFYSWAVYQAILSFIAAYIGIKGIQVIVKRTGKDYYLVFVLAFVILISALIIPFQAVNYFIDKYNDGLNVTGFKNYCTK